MTKKRFSTEKRKSKKQLRRKSRKMRKSMRGGNRAFVKEISRCIPQDPTNYPDIPFSPSGYISNDDNWTKLAKYIYDNGPIEFPCDVNAAKIHGVFDDRFGFDDVNKIGKLYGTIGNIGPVLLWNNGRQQTYEPPITRTQIQRANSLPPLSYRAQ
jgi:hypothetical protein